MPAAEAALTGRPANRRTFEAAGAAAAAELGATDDSDYARALAKTAVIRALADAA
jgi:CO/xanthine dehydrogenase FAD-binding subunit